MDLLQGLHEKLRFIDWMYRKAGESFVETKRKIENSESEFDYSGWDPESFDGEPPFLTQWQEADEAVNLLGQASLSLVQSVLREYLDGCLLVVRAEKPQRKGKESWFDAYQRFFNEQFGIDWVKSPVQPTLVEEINLARNDAQHSGREFGMTRYQDAQHRARFPKGLFADPTFAAMVDQSPLMGPVPLRVTANGLQEAIKRVVDFCSFIDERRPRG
jgi:hypothetical protein